MILHSFIEEKSPSFFETRRSEDQNREKILEQSSVFYSKEEICSLSTDCVGLCLNMFSSAFEQEDCLKLPASQVHHLENLFQSVLKRDLSSLDKINVFDLKVFLNLGPEALYKALRTFGPVLEAQFFAWIAENWQMAQVFYEEDRDFLFLEIFLNKGGDFPINLLRRDLPGDQTFVELAWVKQNDFALFWLDDYFDQISCGALTEDERESCVLAQYCFLSESFKEDILREFKDFKRLKPLIEKRAQSPANFGDFCSDFCSSEKDQNYCE